MELRGAVEVYWAGADAAAVTGHEATGAVEVGAGEEEEQGEQRGGGNVAAAPRLAVVGLGHTLNGVGGGGGGGAMLVSAGFPLPLAAGHVTAMVLCRKKMRI